MASSTNTLDLLVQSQSSKELTANDLFAAASPAMLFARKKSACSGLDWGYYGGVMVVDGALTVIADGTLTLTDASTNYIQASRAGVVSRSTSYTAGQIPLYTAVCSGGVVTSYTDKRAWVQPKHMQGKASVSVTTGNVTLSQAQAACDYLITTGTLTGNRDVIVPSYWAGDVFCNNSGAYTTTFKGSSGTGIIVAQGMRARLRHDGTNVVRITPDT